MVPRESQLDNPACSVTVPEKVWQAEEESVSPCSSAGSHSLTSKLLLNLAAGVAGMSQSERAAARGSVCYRTQGLRVV